MTMKLAFAADSKYNASWVEQYIYMRISFSTKSTSWRLC